jgi:hypothetical protein
MAKRFAILIGVAATGVMALGAQTGAAASEGVVSYGTTLTIFKDQRTLHGEVKSRGGWKCRVGRKVILFKKRPGADRELGTDRSGPGGGRSFFWEVKVKNREIRGPLYAKVTPKVGDGFVCRADTSGINP